MSPGGKDRMKTLDQQMAIYAAYHRNRWNKLTHFIGVPAIIFAILIPLSWISIGDGIALAHVLVGAVLAYYFPLDVPFALATSVATAALLFAARLVSETGATTGWMWFGVFFAGGWISQLVGHVLEGRKPALADNLLQIFVAPIFLVAEVFFALGFKRDVLERVEAQLARPASD